MHKVKIQITEQEWMDTEPKVRNRIIELMTKRGYDTNILEALQAEMNGPTESDVYRQFYGDEE